MTLCVGWIRGRKDRDSSELCFVTDSRLRQGDAWDQGTKLFDLGRRDCLLCFAGDTSRAYPLILQGFHTHRTHVDWTDPRWDVPDLLNLICDLFTKTALEIKDLPRGQTQPDMEVGFLFGGWSWRERDFRLWKILYNADLKAFVPESWHDREDNRFSFAFIGDHTEEAKKLLTDKVVSDDNVLRGTLEMEPLCIVADMARNQTDYPEIGGALQIGKVYPSGNNEFFGVWWPSINGAPHIMGRLVSLYDAPPLRFYNPDTAELIDRLPTMLNELDAFEFDEPIQKYITDRMEGLNLKDTLPEAEKMRLHRIFKEAAYADFIRRQEAPLPETQSREQEANV